MGGELPPRYLESKEWWCHSTVIWSMLRHIPASSMSSRKAYLRCARACACSVCALGQRVRARGFWYARRVLSRAGGAVVSLGALDVELQDVNVVVAELLHDRRQGLHLQGARSTTLQA